MKRSFKKGLEKHNYLVIYLSVGNNEYPFILDTGAPYNIFNPEVVSKLDNETINEVELLDSDVSNMFGPGATGKKTPFDNKYIKLNLWGIGLIRFEYCDMKVAFEQFRKIFGESPMGILGGEFFKQHNACISYKTKTIIID